MIFMIKMIHLILFIQPNYNHGNPIIIKIVVQTI
jgi:hypothetical protein